MIPATPSLINTLEALKKTQPSAKYTLLPIKQGEKTVYFSISKNKETHEITLAISEGIPISAPFTGKSEDGGIAMIGSAWDILNLIKN